MTTLLLSWKSYRWVFVALCALLLSRPTLLTAQSDTSSISGTVTDTTGAVVPNAKVTIQNEATKIERTYTTNAGGSYTATNISPGTYTVKVEAQGFQTAVLSGNRIDPNIGSRIDTALKAGNTATTVTVEANANVLQTESAAAGQLVTSEQVKTIQLNGRNPLYLSQLEPGVVRNAAISAFNFSPDFSGPTINGARANESVLTLDSAPMVRTRANGTQIGVADVDSTSQVQILTTGYPAEYGGTSGGFIRMVPKSGTSTFHGSVYEYLRNSFFNANTWTRNNSDQAALRDHPQAFRYNQFGWNLGGPVYIPGHFNTSKQKLFFLAGQEYLRYRQTVTQQGTVPTALMRQGNFSELLSPNIFYSTTPLQIVNPQTGAPYPGNVIPSGDTSPNGLALLNAYPAPNANSSSFNWQDQAPYPQNQRKDTLVLDYLPSDAHHFRFSLLNYNYDYVNPFAGNFNRTPQKWHWPNQVAVLHYTWSISPTMVNEFTASGSVDHITISYDTSNGLFDRTQYGIDFPYIYPASQKLVPNKIPTIDLANFTTLDGGPYPSHSGGPIVDMIDNLTKVIGSHTLKAGFLWQWSGENNFDQIDVSSTTPGATNNQNGQFNFSDTRSGHPTSGVAAANAALGLFDTYGEIGQKSYTLFRGQMYEGFAQDSWHATPRLLLEYGIRYSVMLPYTAAWRNQSVFDPGSWNPALAPTVDPVTDQISGGDPYNGVVIPGSGFPSSAQGHVPADIISGQYNRLFRGFGAGYSNITWSNVQPRIGFTYQVTPHTVVRGGGGRFVQRIGISDSVQLGGNAPFQPSTTVTAGSVDNPGAVGANSLPLALSSQALNFPDPNAWGWNAAVEQEISNFATFTIQYVGRRGLHLSQIENVNQLQPGTKQANPGVTDDALRPYRGFSAILQDTNAGSSFYNGLQLSLKRRMSRGLLFGIAYTWSKSTDFGSSPGYELPNVYNPRPNYGPSDFDIRNVLVVNYVWDIPYGKDFSNRLARGAVGGWQLSGTTQAQTGEPFNVSTGDDFAGVGLGAGSQVWETTRKPYVSKNFAGSGGKGYWFDPSVFVQPAPGTLAPRGTRNSIYGPGFQSWNIALLKNFHVFPGHENHVLSFKAEAFNFTNHPNLDSPSNDSAMSNPYSATFGQVTTKGQTYPSERQMQFSLRYEF